MRAHRSAFEQPRAWRIANEPELAVYARDIIKEDCITFYCTVHAKDEQRHRFLIVVGCYLL